ncbi:hypothetical protein JKP88DRAFT_243476 [Tribonema minus]|uniref:Uncharacterized protein n=1 Tax=Tribonema minus TaxID=303371 RepID=A0A836CJ40_9STRA|nr:hypothetical protein JKP88DRAFT_243476 [Tribonema minus]
MLWLSGRVLWPLLFATSLTAAVAPQHIKTLSTDNPMNLKDRLVISVVAGMPLQVQAEVLQAPHLLRTAVDNVALINALRAPAAVAAADSESVHSDGSSSLHETDGIAARPASARAAPAGGSVASSHDGGSECGASVCSAPISDSVAAGGGSGADKARLATAARHLIQRSEQLVLLFNSVEDYLIEAMQIRPKVARTVALRFLLGVDASHTAAVTALRLQARPLRPSMGGSPMAGAGARASLSRPLTPPFALPPLAFGPKAARETLVPKDLVQARRVFVKKILPMFRAAFLEHVSAADDEPHVCAAAAAADAMPYTT